jgi:hypothetical protein
MKALTIRQPWAWCIVHAGKDVENRSWSTQHRGPIAIHAAKYWQQPTIYDDFLTARWMSGCALPNAPTEQQLRQMNDQRGHIIAVARLADVVTSSSSPWFTGPYGFLLRDVWPVAPVLVRGKLGLFEVDDSLVPEVA